MDVVLRSSGVRPTVCARLGSLGHLGAPRVLLQAQAIVQQSLGHTGQASTEYDALLAELATIAAVDRQLAIDIALEAANLQGARAAWQQQLEASVDRVPERRGGSV